MIVVAWLLFALGVTHLAFGVVRFRGPIAEAWAAGFVGQFAAPEARRTAFWFLVVGPLLMALGQIAVHAVRTGDRWPLGVIGGYLLATSVVGVAAFPKSPFWATLALAPLFVAGALGVVP
ncbi:MAG: DUF6463 family protein [Myxococcota bacterium]